MNVELKKSQEPVEPEATETAQASNPARRSFPAYRVSLGNALAILNPGGKLVAQAETAGQAQVLIGLLNKGLTYTRALNEMKGRVE